MPWFLGVRPLQFRRLDSLLLKVALTIAPANVPSSLLGLAKVILVLSVRIITRPTMVNLVVARL